MEDITMRKIFQYIMLAVVTIVMASCTSDIEETTATTGKSNVQLVVGEFPAFGDSQTRAIGTPDAGKTSWAEGDELLLEMTSKTLGLSMLLLNIMAVAGNWQVASCLIKKTKCQPFLMYIMPLITNGNQAN